MRCPLALIKMPFVQVALDLYADYKRGITPNGAGIRHETLAYRNAIHALSSLDDESQAWWAREMSPKKGGAS